jgi:hypothetical protein
MGGHFNCLPSSKFPPLHTLAENGQVHVTGMQSHTLLQAHKHLPPAGPATSRFHGLNKVRVFYAMAWAMACTAAFSSVSCASACRMALLTMALATLAVGMVTAVGKSAATGVSTVRVMVSTRRRSTRLHIRTLSTGNDQRQHTVGVQKHREL